MQVETVDSQTGYPIGIYRKGRNLFKSDTNAPITINDLYDSSSWSLYRNGSSQMKAGTYFYVAGGVAASLIGVTVAYTNYDTSDSVLMDFKESTLGICTLCAIPICTVTGAVLRLIGKNKLNTVVNKQNGTKVGSVSFGLQQNGMGMALNF